MNNAQKAGIGALVGCIPVVVTGVAQIAGAQIPPEFMTIFGLVAGALGIFGITVNLNNVPGK